MREEKLLGGGPLWGAIHPTIFALPLLEPTPFALPFRNRTVLRKSPHGWGCLGSPCRETHAAPLHLGAAAAQEEKRPHRMHAAWPAGMPPLLLRGPQEHRARATGRFFLEFLYLN